MSRPTISTAYLESITDDFGVWQHAKGKTIDRKHGYALDDSARALIVFLMLDNKKLAEVCLTYLEVSYYKGKMVGFFDENRKVISIPSSNDALGLALWALACAINIGFERERATKLYNALSQDELIGSKHIRSHAYGLIAATLVNDKATAKSHQTFLLQHYDKKIHWFEDTLRYANAAVPYALLLQYTAKADDKLLQIAKDSLMMLHDQQRIGVFPAPIGNRVWHKLGQITQDVYGQQPIDAAFMVIAWQELAKITNNTADKQNAEYWLSWFNGNNIWQIKLADAADGSCMDGLDEYGPNKNCGAESTIMYVWAQHVLQANNK